MTYLIVEKFYPEKIKALYQRFDEQGRMMPEGVTYINSWIDEAVETCYQIMESESREKLEEWMDNWKGYADFTVIPVITSAQAKEKVFSR